VRYVGTSSGGGEVAVDAGTGDLTFTVNTAADTTFECPVSGGLGGVIDVSNAACDTLGEVCDAINGVNGAGGGSPPGSASGATDFRCVILDGLRSDSSNDTLTTIGATTADAKNGLALTFDSDVALHSSRAIVPAEARSIGFYLNPGPSYTLKPYPFANTRGNVDFAWEDTSTCTGADTFRIVGENNYTFSGETVVNLYGPIATNTTTPVTLTLPQGGVFGEFGSKLVAREACASSFAGGLLAVSGYVTPNSR
jgi:hypothetical protein